MRTIIDNVYRVTGSRSSQIMFLANTKYIYNSGKKSLIFSLPTLNSVDYLAFAGQIALTVILLIIIIYSFKNEQLHTFKLPDLTPISKMKLFTLKPNYSKPINVHPNLLSAIKAEFAKSYYQINLLWLTGFIVLWLIVLENKVEISLSLIPLLFIYSLGYYSKFIEQNQKHDFNRWLGTITKSRSLQLFAEIVVLFMETVFLVFPILVKGKNSLDFLLVGLMTILLAEVVIRILGSSRLFEVIMVIYWFAYLNGAKLLNVTLPYLIIDLVLVIVLVLNLKSK